MSYGIGLTGYKQKNTKVVLLNGPPSSGKDTAAAILVELGKNIIPNDPDDLGFGTPREIKLDRFSFPNKGAFAGISNTLGQLTTTGHNTVYEHIKEQKIDWLGVSYRQFQIDVSEKFMKPLYGKDIFGRLFCLRNKTSQTSQTSPVDLLVVPDSGFSEEAIPVVKQFGKDNVLLIRIHRTGFDFSKDSRSYIENIGCKEIDVNNDAGVNAFKGKILDVVGEWLKEGV